MSAGSPPDDVDSWDTSPLTEAEEASLLNMYFRAYCPDCGWSGSSELCAGGQPIADTGDYWDICCPQCFKDDRIIAVEDIGNFP